MISILVPTRHRLEMMKRFVKSGLETADNPYQIEFVTYIADDDNCYDSWIYPKNVKFKKGPRKMLSLCYEWERGQGPIYMLGADDIIFRTGGWDTKVKQEFKKYPDGIVLVYGNDGDPDTKKVNAAIPFIHRNWIEALGRFLPPYFNGDFTDTWLTALADGVGRKVKIDIYTEHMHPAFKKRELDDTDKEKWEYHFKENMPQKYLDTLPERLEDIEKLKKFIKDFK